MNTVQLIYALQHDKITCKQFVGVFPSDRLPKKMEHYPCGFIANTDPSAKPGTHWVAFYFPSKSEAEFFDSYGYPPEHYKNFKNIFNHLT